MSDLSLNFLEWSLATLTGAPVLFAPVIWNYLCFPYTLWCFPFSFSGVFPANMFPSLNNQLESTSFMRTFLIPPESNDRCIFAIASPNHLYASVVKSALYLCMHILPPCKKALYSLLYYKISSWCWAHMRQSINVKFRVH